MYNKTDQTSLLSDDKRLVNIIYLIEHVIADVTEHAIEALLRSTAH